MRDGMDGDGMPDFAAFLGVGEEDKPANVDDRESEAELVRRGCHDSPSPVLGPRPGRNVSAGRTRARGSGLTEAETLAASPRPSRRSPGGG